MNRIDELFDRARRERKGAFLPFLTAGDPDLATTIDLAVAIHERADRLGVPGLFEIGFPYSDPIADGATIQASYTRALGRGVKVAEIFAMIGEVRKRVFAPLVAMASYSLVFHRGPEAFVASAKSSGLDGAIVPDLPVEEAARMSEACRGNDIHLIQLVAPTTPPARAEKIIARSSGFVYFISVTGITGERSALPPELPKRLEALRRLTTLPVCVGFGISRPEQVELLRPIADGVVVGSAIVRQLESLSPNDAAGIARIADSVESLMRPLGQPK